MRLQGILPLVLPGGRCSSASGDGWFYLVGAKEVFEQADPVFAAGAVSVCAAILLGTLGWLQGCAVGPDATWIVTASPRTRL